MKLTKLPLFWLDSNLSSDLFQANLFDYPDRDTFVVPGITSKDMANLFDNTEWLLFGDLSPQPFGSYRGYVISLDDEGRGLEICCDGWHNFPFWVYDEYMNFYECPNPEYDELSIEIQNKYGKTWVQLLVWHAAKCVEAGLRVDRDYAKARSAFRERYGVGLKFCDDFDDVIAYRGGGLYV